MAAQEIPLAGFRTKLLSRSSVAEGTMAFHFAKPSEFSFKAGQAADLTLLNPPDTDSEGNIRTFSITSPPFEDQLTFATRMRDTAFKRSLKVAPLNPSNHFVLSLVWRRFGNSCHQSSSLYCSAKQHGTCLLGSSPRE
jgi:hypothetical protein